MSVRIDISRDNGTVVFSDPRPQQSDLVFWHNGDTDPHWPVPFCTGLQVAPQATSEPYQAVPPNQTFPLAIKYGCAIAGHEAESGTLTVQADTVAPPPATSTAKGATQTIVIGEGGVFPELNVVQIDFIVWNNQDTRTHHPVPNCTGLQVKPGAVSNDMHPAPPPGPPTLPISVDYGCAIPGHESERGMINVFNTFVLTSPTVAVSPVTPYVAVPLLTGGMSPYTINPDPSATFLTLAETVPAGSSAGISVALNGPPPAGKTSVTYALDVTDALQTNIRQAITINLAYGALTAIPTATIFSKVKPFAAVPVLTGGQSPYKLTPDPAHPYLSLVETAPAGSSTGVSAVLNTDPPASGPISYQLNVTDATNKNLTQAITIILI